MTKKPLDWTQAAPSLVARFGLSPGKVQALSRLSQAKTAKKVNAANDVAAQDDKMPPRRTGN